jgi:hypothetical protein
MFKQVREMTSSGARRSRRDPTVTSAERLSGTPPL